MAVTRREFIQGATVVGAATLGGTGLLVGAEKVAQAAESLHTPVDSLHDGLSGELGSPYLLSSHGPDSLLGEDGYERMREEIIQFGMSEEDRDRYHWGL